MTLLKIVLFAALVALTTGGVAFAANSASDQHDLMAMPLAAPHCNPGHSCTPVSTPTVTPTRSVTPTAAVTPTPTITPTPVATPTGTYCSAAVHDAYTTTGPDGVTYPTWHPQIQPAGMPEAGCSFGHEHGYNPTDPALQTANNTPPAFGYVAAVAGMAEPHAGFKVVTIRHGECDTHQPSLVFPADYRIIVHTGTAGIGRYVTQMHSAEYSYKGFDIRGMSCMGGSPSALNMAGLDFNVQMMADTGTAAQNDSVCTSPRLGSKTFSTLGCTQAYQPQTAYEIWANMAMFVCQRGLQFCERFHAPLAVGPQPAVNDPITTRDPTNDAALIYTQDVVYPGSGIAGDSTASAFRGCNRETNVGGIFLNNATGQLVWYSLPDGTDALSAPDATHVLRQTVAQVTRNDTSAFYHRDELFCSSTTRAPN